MRGAPAVGVTVAAGAGWRAVVAALVALAAAAGTAWLAGRLGAFAAMPALALAGGAVGFATGWSGRALGLAPRSASQLRFDGVQWQLDGEPGRAMLALDLGRFVLLRFVSDAVPGEAGEPGGPRRQRRRHRWIAAGASASRGDWHGLRIALHAPAAPAGPPR